METERPAGDREEREARKDLFSQERSERRFYEEILRAVPDPLVVLDASGVIEWLNHPAEKWFLETNRHLAGRRLLDLPQDAELLRLGRLVFEKEGLVKNEEVHIGVPTPCIARVSFFPIAPDGKMHGMVLLIQDVTENRNRELQRYQKDSIQALASLTAGLAHEIKNPLGALDLHLQLLDRFLRAHEFKDKREVEDIVAVLSDEVRRLDQVVNDFLFSVRPIRARRKSESLSTVARETLRVLGPELEALKVHVEIDLAEDLPLLSLDLDVMKQALMNVVKNGVQAMQEANFPCWIRISTRRVDDRVVLSVQDRGPGIPAGSLAKIFEPFYTTRAKGTGLGLTIVYRIVEEHQGEIVIQSEEGKGTDFRMEFALSKQPVKFLDTHQEDPHGSGH